MAGNTPLEGSILTIPIPVFHNIHIAIGADDQLKILSADVCFANCCNNPESGERRIEAVHHL